MSTTRRDFLTTSTAALGAMLVPRRLFPQTADKPQPAADENIFLFGDFAPVREESTVADLRVEGKLPPDLNGFFLRIGPNPQFAPQNKYHVFEGDGMIHGVHLENGKASYRNRYVCTAAWKKEHAAGKALYPSVLDPIDWKQFGASLLSSESPVPNRANTALVWHHGKLLALWEGGYPHEIVLPDLSTRGEYNFAQKLSHNFTAHPKVDSSTGELIFFGYQPVAPYLQHSIADRTGRITHTTPVPLPRPTMIHDAAITANYTVFIDTPALFDLTGLLRQEPFLKWSPEHGARLGVLPRYAAGSKIKWFDIEPCFVFHVFNAYEEGNEIVLHACRYRKYPEFVDFSGRSTVKNFDRMVDDAASIAFTWRVNLQTGRVVEKALDDSSTEFPQVNQHLNGKRTRYGYCSAFTDVESCTFHKYDFDTGKRVSHRLGQNRLTGEGIFVPRENTHAEDDGYLLAISYDRDKAHTELVVMPAGDFAGTPLARVIIPRRVPFGFHAAWAPLS